MVTTMWSTGFMATAAFLITICVGEGVVKGAGLTMRGVLGVRSQAAVLVGFGIIGVGVGVGVMMGGLRSDK